MHGYTLDNIGQRLTNKITSSDVSSRTEEYGYDPTNRLTSVDYGDGQTQSYAFDPMGNRLSKSDSLNGNESYSYDNANRLLTRGSNSYANDIDGNTLTGGGRTNVWDSENRLVSCTYNGTTSSYTYGSDGLRRRATVAGTTTDFVLDATIQIRELHGGVDAATYLVGARGPEYRRDDGTGAVRWYLYDGLGSVLGELDPSGNITATRKFDVYGGVRSSTGTASSKQKFCGSLGHPSDDETGLIYMRARYMDPVTGRFATEDPAQQGSNWYAYAADNPTRYADRDGKETTTGDGELDYDMVVTAGGFAMLAWVLGIIAGRTATLWSAVNGSFMNLTGSESKIAQRYKRSREAVEAAIEDCKQDGIFGGARDNPDVLVDLDTGEVYIQLPDGSASEDSIGNIRDYLK